MKTEVCVNSVVSAIEAQRGGADRVELCENMADGGCTPSAGAMLEARRNLHIGIMVMIRPRGGDFLYNDTEFAIMEEDIRMAKRAGADGVVFGMLRPDGTIDRERMARLADCARPLSITCHRAFDMTRDAGEALEILIALGIGRVLTSGQQPNAYLGIPLLHALTVQAAGRISIMPGGGVREHNIEEIINKTGVSEVHIHPEKRIKSGMEWLRDSVYMGNPDTDEYSVSIADADAVSRFVSLTKNL
jgi:copper homeostasis protein